MSRPRPVEHFDDPALAWLLARNRALEEEVRAWRLRFYCSQLRSPAAGPAWEPVIPQQRQAPDQEHLPAEPAVQHRPLGRAGP